MWTSRIIQTLTIVITLKIKDSVDQNLMTNSLSIFLFIRNCEPKISLPVQQIKTKTILRSQLVRNV